MTRTVAPLQAFGAADIAQVGGKAANLGELLRAGLPVPPGFVVTTGAYAHVARRAGLDDLLGAADGEADGDADPAALRAAIDHAGIDADARAAIVAAYERLGADTPVAVRSSATAEDLPGAAFAGQQDTYLNVVGATAVVDAVRRCWASLWTDRAVAYRAAHAIDQAQVRIAVVVQAMVDAEVAGVMFTADPVSGARDQIVIDAAAGLGEAVVSGRVTPDHYVLDARGRTRSFTPGRDEVVIRPAAGGGVAEHSGDRRSAPLLGGDRLAELAAHAGTIAAHFGRPQDIEWAITDDSNRALAELAAQVRADPALRACVLGRTPAEVWDDVRTDDRYRGFRTDLTSYLTEFGRRETTSPLLISAPTLAESPDVVIGMVQAAAERPLAPAASAPSAAALEQLLAHPWLRGARRQHRIRAWVRAAQDGVAFREDTHFYFTAALPTLRRSILEIGRRLHAVGLLDAAEDVLHLRLEEIATIADPATVLPQQAALLRQLVAQRAAKRAQLAGIPLIDAARVFPASGGADDALVTGTPAGAGIATGPARIIRDAADFDRLQPGDVLVCPATNPAWTPLFQRAVAVVVDSGAAVSHAAIVAREYGLPAVMGTGTGTAVLTDGELITVDGARGRVTRAA
ncbi:PEP/pyruvate-binding domain-containing protein [Microbacterium kribbense]